MFNIVLVLDFSPLFLEILSIREEEGLLEKGAKAAVN